MEQKQPLIIELAKLYAQNIIYRDRKWFQYIEKIYEEKEAILMF